MEKEMKLEKSLNYDELLIQKSNRLKSTNYRSELRGFDDDNMKPRSKSNKPQRGKSRGYEYDNSRNEDVWA